MPLFEKPVQTKTYSEYIDHKSDLSYAFFFFFSEGEGAVHCIFGPSKNQNYKLYFAPNISSFLVLFFSFFKTVNCQYDVIVM